MNRRFLTIVITIATFTLISSCANKNIDWKDFENDPQSYEGSRVSICGWLRMEMEDCSLARSPSKNYGGPGMIWVSPADGECARSNNSDNLSGWHLVSGKFRYSADFRAGGFGHLGSYGAEISEAKIISVPDGCGKLPPKRGS